MIRDILNDFKIKYFAHISCDRCSVQNRRLYESVPDGCRVVFMLFPYYVEKTDPILAKFAAVPDYHRFAAEVFEKLEEYIKNTYGAVYAKGFSDHSPFKECEGAADAGLGVIGRNGLLINKEYSSFVCIGELVCSLSVDVLDREGIPNGDNADRDICDDCGKCVSACPGGCAGSEGRENCVSALNQRKKAPEGIETEIIRNGGYAWGCDSCQMCCPYTERARKIGSLETPISFFKDGAIIEDAREIIEKMSDSEYEKYPFSWRKREVIMRNFDLLNKD